MELKKTEKLEKSVVALTMEISAAEFEKAKNQAFKKAGRNIQVPGFRKGKAPRMLIEKMYGDVFFEDALNIVYPDAMEKAVEESGIKPRWASTRAWLPKRLRSPSPRRRSRRSLSAWPSAWRAWRTSSARPRRAIP